MATRVPTWLEDIEASNVTETHDK